MSYKPNYICDVCGIEGLCWWLEVNVRWGKIGQLLANYDYELLHVCAECYRKTKFLVPNEKPVKDE